MTRDTLATLIKIRRLACDEALRGLVAAVEAEDRALRASNEIERAMAQEIEMASDPASPDEVVEAYGHWLQQARRQLEAAQSHFQRLQVETSRKRAELTACRTALESVETLQQQRRDEAARTSAQKQQRELDDRPAGWSVYAALTGDEA